MVAVKLVTELPAGGRGVGRHRNEDAQTLLDAAIAAPGSYAKVTFDLEPKQVGAIAQGLRKSTAKQYPTLVVTQRGVDLYVQLPAVVKAGK